MVSKGIEVLGRKVTEGSPGGIFVSGIIYYNLISGKSCGDEKVEFEVEN
ncbi:MAG: hypothetical protein KJ893_05150 [Candidatus Omnitrophica bacterium]|nr:hypothetical protein [Candidatus Omnitrophota bacterium]MBU4478210.1 hypothetical protein [Candidatus Omnitrophota bacterium]